MKNTIGRNAVLMMVFLGLFLFSVNTALAKDPVDKVFNYAESLYDVNLYGDAIVEYMKVVNLYPDNAFKGDASYRIAECLYRNSSDQMPLAIELWNKFIADYPANKYAEKAKENVTLVKMLIQNVEPPVTSVEDKLARRFTDFANFFRWSCVWESGGVVSYEEDFKATALATYDIVAAKFPSSPSAIKALFTKATLYEELKAKKYYLLAIEEYQKIADKYPGTYYAYEAMVNIGDIYETNLGRRKDSLAAYQKLVDALKGDPGSYYAAYAQEKIDFYK